ncbi:MAG: hypothetical protein ACK5WV_13210 [Chryseotalea sp.]
MSKRTAIMGFGNPVRSDDAIGIYVIEQDESELFNRAILMNIGFKEAINDEKNINLKWDCFIFHDVK